MFANIKAQGLRVNHDCRLLIDAETLKPMYQAVIIVDKLGDFMGLSFISEGAIPFASADPLRTIPSFIVGSAVTGALSMLFNCTLRAPHGGIFVIATIGHPLKYILAIAAGAIVSALIMAKLKKNLPEYNKSK